MIVWSGRGFLSVVVLLISFLVCSSILPKEQGDFGFVISFFIAGAFSWFMGKKWNEEGGRTMIDKESGQEVIIKPNHSLFWIKMQYWGPVFGVLGLIILVQQFI
ncbi:MAG: hypothetical protein AAFQ94_13495 [Bacteroidota bacterium]